MGHRAVFLDRDGTINEEVGYVNHLERFTLLPGVGQAIRLLNQFEIKAVVITNQSGVARGYFPESLIHLVHQKMQDLLRMEGARLDGIYYCPHHPEVGDPPYRQKCRCRKPETGLVEEAVKELDLDFKTYPPRAFLATLGKLKNDGITPDQYKPSQFNIFQKRLALVYQRYQENLRRNNALDFEDLLHFVVILFHRFPEVLTSYQDLCRYVMVDEFQDTNLIQYHLIRRLVERHQNICVVGDDDQSDRKSVV
jgi:D,D-heptose 1,7-bisphosphate phosphatase